MPRRPGPQRLRRPAVGAAVLVISVALPGCGVFSSTPEPREAAEQLASGLARGDLSHSRFSGTTPSEATAFVQKAEKGLGGTRPKVTVTAVDTSGGKQQATATLRSEWALGGQTWAYETKAPMRLVNKEWQVAWSPALVAPDLGADEVLRSVQTQPKRADILDRNGAPLVTEREVAKVGIDKAKVDPGQQGLAARSLAALVGVDGGSYAAKVAAAGPKEFVQAILLRQDDPTLTARRSAIEAVPGGTVVAELRPLGPTRTWGQPVLGTVGPASAEAIARSKGAVKDGDVVGQGGLQLAHDARLRGTPGVSVRAVTLGADGSALKKRELFLAGGTPGAPLKLTLDERMQSAAEDAISSEQDLPAGIVVMDASTGGVLAAASSPGAKGRNVALKNQAPPGSTFKIVSSLALTRKGVDPDTPVPCTSTIVAANREFHNYSDFPSDHVGNIPLKSALAVSCNTAFISFHKKISQQDLIDAAGSLGMGQDLDVGFPAYLGSVPQTSDAPEHVATFIGQGRVEASPLTMATVMSSVIKGQTVRPRLVDGLPAKPNPAPSVPLTSPEVQALRIELREVTQVGSGKKLKGHGVEYSKTGTAEFGAQGQIRKHVWMVAGKGNLAIAVFVEEGDNGADDAGPIVSAFLDKIG